MQIYMCTYRFCYLVNSQMLLETDYTALVAHAAGKQLYGEGVIPAVPRRALRRHSSCRRAWLHVDAAPWVEGRSWTAYHLLSIN